MASANIQGVKFVFRQKWSTKPQLTNQVGRVKLRLLTTLTSSRKEVRTLDTSNQQLLDDLLAVLAERRAKGFNRIEQVELEGDVFVFTINLTRPGQKVAASADLAAVIFDSLRNPSPIPPTTTGL